MDAALELAYGEEPLANDEPRVAEWPLAQPL